MNQLKVTEFKNIRVLTTQQLAEKYEADPQVLTNNFNRNKNRYEECKHYIALEGEDKRDFINLTQIDLGSAKNAKTLYLWTEKGAFLHAKSLNTDKAWEVYDRLVDTYFKVKEQKTLSNQEIMRIQLSMIDDVVVRVDKLENTMVIDYGQQRVLERLVNNSVVTALGGKKSVAYKEVGKKVFSECNRDIKDRFDVNSRSNIPRAKYDEACTYIKKWQPCTNTRMLIEDCNAQGVLA